MVNRSYQTWPSGILIPLYYYNSLLGRELHFQVQRGRHDPNGMDPWSRQNHCVRRESICHYKIHNYLFSFCYHNELDLPCRHHHFPVKSHQRGIILRKVLICQTQALIEIGVHYLCLIALINHNSFDEESPDLEGYDQCVIMWLSGPLRSLSSKVAFFH